MSFGEGAALSAFLVARLEVLFVVVAIVDVVVVVLDVADLRKSRESSQRRRSWNERCPYDHYVTYVAAHVEVVCVGWESLQRLHRVLAFI